MLFVTDADLDRLLAEDVGQGDLTTAALGLSNAPGIMRFAARGPMVACATEEAARMLARVGLAVRVLTGSGTAVAAGTPLLVAEGPAAAIHAGWKVTQTLIEWASGIASGVRDIVAAVSRDCVVACTRKTAPLTRALSIKAVRAGGGTMHRTGLGETVLVFPEHLAFLPDLDERAIIARLRSRAPERMVTAEVGNVAAALRWAGASVDMVQLDKFAPDQVAQVAIGIVGLPRRPVLAAAGGINARNAAAYAASGANVLVTSAPYSAPPRDVQVTIEHA